MDESSADVTTSLKKRQAESDLAEETDDESGEEEPAEKTEVNGSDPEWDVDSFDGREYHSSEEFNEFSDEEHDKDKLCRQFKRQIIANKGFYVDPELNKWSLYSKIKLVRNLDKHAVYGQTYREYFTDMARLCLKIYNEKKGFNVEFVEVVRGYYKFGKRSKAYITFKAKEQPDGPDVEYQAKTWSPFLKANYYPIFCRPAPIAKPSNQNK